MVRSRSRSLSTKSLVSTVPPSFDRPTREPPPSTRVRTEPTTFFSTPSTRKRVLPASSPLCALSIITPRAPSPRPPTPLFPTSCDTPALLSHIASNTHPPSATTHTPSTKLPTAEAQLTEAVSYIDGDIRSSSMDAEEDSRRHGARWGFRTPSPGFARRAVSPLSPPSASQQRNPQHQHHHHHHHHHHKTPSIDHSLLHRHNTQPTTPQKNTNTDDDDDRSTERTQPPPPRIAGQSQSSNRSNVSTTTPTTKAPEAMEGQWFPQPAGPHPSSATPCGPTTTTTQPTQPTQPVAYHGQHVDKPSLRAIESQARAHGGGLHLLAELASLFVDQPGAAAAAGQPSGHDREPSSYTTARSPTSTLPQLLPPFGAAATPRTQVIIEALNPLGRLDAAAPVSSPPTSKASPTIHQAPHQPTIASTAFDTNPQLPAQLSPPRFANVQPVTPFPQALPVARSELPPISSLLPNSPQLGNSNTATVDAATEAPPTPSPRFLNAIPVPVTQPVVDELRSSLPLAPLEHLALTAVAKDAGSVTLGHGAQVAELPREELTASGPIPTAETRNETLALPNGIHGTSVLEPLPSNNDSVSLNDNPSDRVEHKARNLPTPTQEDHVIQQLPLIPETAQLAVDASAYRTAQLTPEIVENHDAKAFVLQALIDSTKGVNSADIAVEDRMEVDNTNAIMDDPMDTDDSAVTDQVDQVVIPPPPVTHKSPKRRYSSTAPKKSNRRKSGTTARPRPPTPAGTEDGCQTCNTPYSQDDGQKGSWIGCDGCKAWHHARCVDLEQYEVDKIDKFYCRQCEPVFGKSTMKRTSNRAHTAIDYNALHNGSSIPLRNPDDSRIHPYINTIRDRTYPFAKDNFQRFRPEQITMEFLDSMEGGWNDPFIIPAKFNPTPWHNAGPHATASGGAADGTDVKAEEFILPPASAPVDGTLKPDGTAYAQARRSTSTGQAFESVAKSPTDGLGMAIPSGLTPRKVAEIIGLNRPVEIINCLTQQSASEKWNMEKLANYMENPIRDTVYNCISCEVTDTELGPEMVQPKAVSDTDLVERVWRSSRWHKPPRVGKYILMSVKDSFTDFHIDFAGSSVFYHIYKGQKVFLAVPPTDQALKAYEEWSTDPNMNTTFFPSLVPDLPCTLFTLSKGDTLFIPSGWIHAVYTPMDSFVFGGNFLTRNHYHTQSRVQSIEVNTGVRLSMRYPKYSTLMWNCLYDYISKERIPEDVDSALQELGVLTRKSKLPTPKKGHKLTYQELEGLTSLVAFLYRQAMISVGAITTSDRPGNPKLTKEQVNAIKKAIPEPINTNPLRYVKTFARWCIWQRAARGVNPDLDRMPYWAHDDWQPEVKAPEMTAAAMKKLQKLHDDKFERAATPRRSGLRERNALSMTPDEPPLFPPTSSTPAPSKSKTIKKRKSEVHVGGPPKQTKVKAAPLSSATSSTTPGGPAEPPMLLEDGERITLSDGCIYVRKNSNLGPPRAGCQNCRLKKTGCRHKEEIAEILKGHWSGPSATSLESWAAKLAEPKRGDQEGVQGEDGDVVMTVPPLTVEELDDDELTDLEELARANPRVFSPEFKDDPSVLREKTPAPKEKSPMPKETTPAPREQTPAPRSTTPAPKAKTPVLEPTPSVTPVLSSATPVIAIAPPAMSPPLPSGIVSPVATPAAPVVTPAAPPPSAPFTNGDAPPTGFKGRKPSCPDCKALKKKCPHPDTWSLTKPTPPTKARKSSHPTPTRNSSPLDVIHVKPRASTANPDTSTDAIPFPNLATPKNSKVTYAGSKRSIKRKAPVEASPEERRVKLKVEDVEDIDEADMLAMKEAQLGLRARRRS